MARRDNIRSFLLISLLILILPSASSAPDAQAVTYSIVHISDTQHLATHHPGTLNRTFSHIESLKEPYNISAIIFTGDAVNAWDSTKEWDTYSNARNLTTTTVYQIAGNHDTAGGSHYQYYTAYTGMPKENYVTSIIDLDFVGINYAETSYPAKEFSRLRQFLDRSPHSFAIIATHYYMDVDGRLSPLGRGIDTSLIVKPSLVLTGHMHAHFIRSRTVRGFMVVADMTNYQDGVPGGTAGLNYSAGTLYTVSSAGGQVETITARIIHFFPEPYLDEEMTIFARNHDVLSASVAVFSGASLGSCSLSCRLDELFWVRTDLRQAFF